MATQQRFSQRIPGTTNITDVVPATQGGSAYAGQIAGLDPVTGLLAQSMMPTGIGATVVTGTANSALTAGQFVNVLGGTIKPADATTPLKANGFVLQNYAANATGCTVYLAGLNTAVSGLTPGPQYLSTAGSSASSTTSTPGNIAQYLGDALTATAIEFNPGVPITIA